MSNVYKCLKELIVNHVTLFKKGQIVDADSLSNMIKIDFTQTEYFKKVELSFNEEQYVLYNNQYSSKKQNVLCWIEEVDNLKEKYLIREVNGHSEFYTAEKELTPVDVYWFINSEGKIHMTYIGKNPCRDEYTGLMHNRFERVEYARAFLDDLKKGRKTIEII